MSALSAISVDLDSPKHYCRIYGLPESILDDAAVNLVERVAIPRFLELFANAQVPATFFAVGEDLERPSAAQAIKTAAQAGVEIASHSYAHDYAMSRGTAEAIGADLQRADALIERSAGVRPVGFRAPGYTLTPSLLNATVAQGYAYGSSTFPAAPYYGLKALVMGVQALVGKPSRSILDSPRVLTAPRAPYHPSESDPYARGSLPVWELPVTVTPVFRVPFYGTLAVALPWAWVAQTYRSAATSELMNFELHAIDVLDATDGWPQALASRQRDLGVPASEKMKRLATLFSWFARDGECLTLAGVAHRLSMDEVKRGK